LGHADTKQTQHYAKMHDYQVSEDMLLLEKNLMGKGSFEEEEENYLSEKLRRH
jgi:hypothetical protein